MKKEGKGFARGVTPLFQTMMVQDHEEMGEGLKIPTDPHHTPIIQPSTSQPQKKQSRRKQRKDTKIPKSSGPIEHITDEVANEEHVPTQSNDPPLLRVNILGSGEDILSLKELMDLYTKPSDRVLDLETTKTAQALEIDSLKRRVKKLEKKQKSRIHNLKILYKAGLSSKVISSNDEGLGDQEDTSKQGRKISDIDVDVEVTLIDETQRRNDDNLMFDIGALDEQEVKVKKTLIEIKATKPKVRGVMIQEPIEFTTTTTPAALKPLQDKGKEKMIEPEEPLKMKPKDQVLFDEQEDIRLQAQFDEEERIAREKEEANAALITQWNDIQDKVETDYELAQRLQVEEQEELTIEEKSKLFQQLLEKRRKHFEAKRA
ncbi:hypothetical protein Tco_1440995 [Tanacetum coccineum]